MINHEADKFIKQIFDSLKNRYENNLKSIKGSEFLFDDVHLLYYKCYKRNPNCGGSYIDSPDWIKIKKSNNKARNPINKKNEKSFQYAVTVVLNPKEIGENAEKITKIKPFMNKYKWKRINFSSEKVDWKKIEKNDLLMLYMLKKKEICCTYVSKYNSNREKQVIVLMIPDGERWHYLAVKKLSALLRGITSKFNDDFYYLNCLHSFRTKKNLNLMRKYVKIKIFVML